MKIQIYVNLPVKDLKRSSAFFEKLGFEFFANLSEDPEALISEDV